jgi:hypothetical protein
MNPLSRRLSVVVGLFGDPPHGTHQLLLKLLPRVGVERWFNYESQHEGP